MPGFLVRSSFSYCDQEQNYCKTYSSLERMKREMVSVDFQNSSELTSRTQRTGFFSPIGILVISHNAESNVRLSCRINFDCNPYSTYISDVEMFFMSTAYLKPSNHSWQEHNIETNSVNNVILIKHIFLIF